MGLKDWSRLKLLRAALWLAQRKPPPPNYEIPLSGEEGERVDCFIISLGAENSNTHFSFGQLTPTGARGLWHAPGNVKAFPCTITNQTISESTLFRAQHFLKGHALDYPSMRSFFWALASLDGWRRVRRSRALQRRFNKTTLVKRDRTTVLRSYVERTLSDPEYVAGTSRLLTELHTGRWAGHPEHDRLLVHYEMIVRSLENSGDIEKKKYGYALTAKGVTTLAHYEEDDRRHRDNIRQQTIMGVLTAALVFIALLQAFITYWVERPADALPPAAAPPRDSTSTPPEPISG